MVNSVPDEQSAETPFSSIIGYQDVKQNLETLLNQLHNIDDAPARVGAGLSQNWLFYGPSGTGKSEFLQELAERSPIETWYENGSTFTRSSAMKDKIDLMHRLFDDANVLIIIDDIDIIARRRNPTTVSTSEQDYEALLNQLLVELQRIRPEDNVFFVAASSRKDILEPALLQVMYRQVEVTLPDIENRRDILQHYNHVYDCNWSPELIERVAHMTIGASGRKLHRLVTSALQMADREPEKLAQGITLMEAMRQEGLSIPDTSDIAGIIERLDNYVSGQAAAKSKAVFAAASHFSYTRDRLENPEGVNLETNILLIGPEGIGKANLAEGLAKALQVPFAKGNASISFDLVNLQDTLRTWFRQLYELSDGDVKRAEHGIIYLYNLDKLAVSGDVTDHIEENKMETRRRLQQRLHRIIDGETIDFEITSPLGTKQSIKFYTGNILYICGGTFDELETQIKNRLGTNDISQQEVMMNLHPQDLVNYGLSVNLIDALSIIVPMEELTQDEVDNLIDEHLNSEIAQSYTRLFEKNGIHVELTPDGRAHLIQTARDRKAGSGAIASMIRNIFIYIWTTMQDATDIILVDKPMVNNALNEREISADLGSNSAITTSGIPDVSFDQIGGLRKQIVRIRQEIENPIRYGEIYQRYGLERPKGILLYGPPGTGKTMIAKAIANSLHTNIRRDLHFMLALHALHKAISTETATPVATLVDHWLQVEDGARPEFAALLTGLEHGPAIDIIVEQLATLGVAMDNIDYEMAQIRQGLQHSTLDHFISIRGAELSNKYVGETERRLRELFASARARASAVAPVVLYFDEIDALFGKRGMTDNKLAETLVPQMLTEMDGLDSLANVVVIGSTNRQELLDPALTRPGRLEVKLEIPRADRIAAKEILRGYLNDTTILSEELVQQHDGSEAQALDYLQERLLELLYHPESIIHIRGHGLFNEERTDTGPWSKFVSGAILEYIVQLAKKQVAVREIEAIENQQSYSPGLSWRELYEAAVEAFEENKSIFGDEIIWRHLAPGESTAGIIYTSIPAVEMEATDVSQWNQRIKRPWKKSMQAETGF